MSKPSRRSTRARFVAPFGAYSTSTIDEVRGTLADFRHMHAFLASDKLRMKDPTPNAWMGGIWDKEQTRKYISKWIDDAINRKGGIEQARSEWKHWQNNGLCFFRDREALKNIRHRIRTYSFESRACKERFGHLLSKRNED